MVFDFDYVHIKKSGSPVFCEAFTQTKIIESVRRGTTEIICRGSLIKWGGDIQNPIPKGVISKNFKQLLLPPGYRHNIEQSEIPDTVTIYIHESDAEIVPMNRASVFLWKYSDNYVSDVMLDHSQIMFQEPDKKLRITISPPVFESKKFTILSKPIIVIACYREYCPDIIYPTSDPDELDDLDSLDELDDLDSLDELDYSNDDELDDSDNDESNDSNDDEYSPIEQEYIEKEIVDNTNSVVNDCSEFKNYDNHYSDNDDESLLVDDEIFDDLLRLSHHVSKANEITKIIKDIIFDQAQMGHLHSEQFSFTMTVMVLFNSDPKYFEKIIRSNIITDRLNIQILDSLHKAIYNNNKYVDIHVYRSNKTMAKSLGESLLLGLGFRLDQIDSMKAKGYTNSKFIKIANLMNENIQ